MASIRIGLFGNLRITWGSEPVTSVNTARLQSLLAFLVLHGDVPQSREHLSFLLWPESNESQSRTNLRQLLHHLRRALPADCRLIATDNQTVCWRLDPDCSVDVLEFDRALSQAMAAQKRGDGRAELQALGQAAELYTDDLLPGLYDEWLQRLRDDYRRRLAEVLQRLAAVEEERGEHAAAIRHADRLLAQDPLSEGHYQLLIRLYAANQDRSGALRVYHQCMRTLRRELGVEPCAATRELFERVLKSEPARVAQPEAPPTAASASSPIIGRRDEWERLMGCWRSALRGGAHLAVIQGEPGIGKSRLAEELHDWCLRNHHAVARTRCYAGLGQLAYAPIADWLRSEPVTAARAHLSPSQLAELSRVLPEILEEQSNLERPHPLTESWQRLRFYESLNAAFSRAAKPLLLLIDDLQWCDPDSFEWLHSLFRWPAAARILVLATLRPEEAGRDHPYSPLLSDLRRSGQAVEIPLLPLSAEETAELAMQTAECQIAAPELEALFRATKGHPLFVIESVRAGLQTPSGSATPPRIHAVLAARFAQLSRPSYELAGIASAVGRPFSFDLLAKATDWDESSLSQALDELWQRHIIEGHGTSEYDFTHDRLREVAYAELGLVRQRFLHRRIARAIEEVYGGDLDSYRAQLAAHYESAAMPDQAIALYRGAAAVARQRYADSEAAASLRRALALCRAFPDTQLRRQQELELLVTLGPALVTTQGYATPEVGETYARALELSRHLEDRNSMFVIISGSWVFHAVRGQVEKSRALAEEFLELAGREDVAALSMAGHFLLGSSLFHMGRCENSYEHMREALRAYSGPSHSVLALFAGPDVGVFCRSYVAHLQWHLGDVDQAAVAIGEAIASARSVSHPFSMAIVLDYAAMLHVFRRESGAALAWSREAAAVCSNHHFAYYGAVAQILGGWALAFEGEPHAGIAQLRQGMEDMKATGAEIRLPFYYGLLAEACALAGQTGEALANISNGFAFQNKNGELWAASDLHRIHGDLLMAGGNGGQAQAAYQRAVDTARQSGSRSFELRATARMSELLSGTSGAPFPERFKNASDGKV